MDDQLAQELQSNEHRFEDLPSEKQERLRAIVDLRRRNVTNATIAKLLNVGEATVYRDSQLLRQLNVSRATQLDIKEEIGDVLNFFDEIADKAMEGHRSAIEDSEKTVLEDDGQGNKKAVVKNAPDHPVAQRYLIVATTAKKQKLDSLLQVTTTHSVNKLLEVQTQVASQMKPVSELKTPEDFEQAKKVLDTQMYEAQKKLHIYRGPSPMDYAGNHGQYKIDMATHMKKLDEFMKAKEEFEKPWPHRKIRK